MIEILYKVEGRIEAMQTVEALTGLRLADVVWIDMVSPEGEEKRAVESFLGISLQTRAQAEEIESSSRYSETETAVFINTNFISPAPDDYTQEAVSFIVSDAILTTLRENPLRSFTVLQRRMQAYPRNYPDGFSVFVSILEQRVDLDADMIEIMSQEIAQYNKKVSLGEDVNEEFLLDINQLQENTMLVRENVVDKQRMVSSLLRSDLCPKYLTEKLEVLLKDIASLINHTNFSFERLEYLQNTVIGIINLDQNKIMKIFTLVSLLLMPPTLIASIFGMNVNFGNYIAESSWAWIVILGMMVLSFVVVIVVFKIRKIL